MTTENSNLQDLMDAFSLENLIKGPTCFKSTVPTTIDLIVTNQKSLFMKSSAYESGSSDFHKLTTTILEEIQEIFFIGTIKYLIKRNLKINFVLN